MRLFAFLSLESGPDESAQVRMKAPASGQTRGHIWGHVFMNWGHIFATREPTSFELLPPLTCFFAGTTGTNQKIARKALIYKEIFVPAGLSGTGRGQRSNGDKKNARRWSKSRRAPPGRAAQGSTRNRKPGARPGRCCQPRADRSAAGCRGCSSSGGTDRLIRLTYPCR